MIGEVLAIGSLAGRLGVHVSTLRRWGREGEFPPGFRTPGGHRRWRWAEVCEHFGWEQDSTKATCVLYSRVSSLKQAKAGDLERQAEGLRAWAKANSRAEYVEIKDVGSGINFKRR